MAESLAAVGWRFLLVFSLQAAAILPNTLAWRRMLPPEHRAAFSRRSLAAMLLAGDAVNAVTPSAVVGGELVRISLLKRRIPTLTAAGASSLAAMAQCFAQILFVLTGVPVALSITADESFRAALTTLAAVAGLALAMLVALGWSKSGWEALLRRLERAQWWVRLRRGREASWRELADATLGALQRHPADFAVAVALYYAGWLVGAVEAWLILFLLHAVAGWKQAFVIEALSLAIEAVFFFVPAKMGTQEGGKYLIFRALRLDPARGVALGLVRRLRELAWAGVGLALLGALQRRPAAGGSRPGILTGPGEGS